MRRLRGSALSPLYQEGKINTDAFEGGDFKLRSEDGVNLVDVQGASKIEKGFKLAQRYPELEASDLYDKGTESARGIPVGEEYYRNELVPNPVSVPAFSNEMMSFTETGLSHVLGQDERALTPENTARRMGLLPKAKAVLENTPLVDEVRTRPNGDKEYGLLGKFKDGSVIRVVVEQVNREGKSFLSVYDWANVGKKVKRASLSSSPSATPGYEVDKAPSERDENNLFSEADNVKDADESLTQSHKGAVQFLKDGKAILHLFQTADFKTIIHELGHTFRRQMSPEDLGGCGRSRSRPDKRAADLARCGRGGCRAAGIIS